MAGTELVEPLVDRAGQDVVLTRRHEPQALEIAVDFHLVGVASQRHIPEPQPPHVQARARTGPGQRRPRLGD